MTNKDSAKISCIHRTHLAQSIRTWKIIVICPIEIKKDKHIKYYQFYILRYQIRILNYESLKEYFFIRFLQEFLDEERCSVIYHFPIRIPNRSFSHVFDI